MDYFVDKDGKTHHKCEGVSGWDEIYLERNREWTLSLSAGDGKTQIKYCPWCGTELKLTR